MSNRDDLIRYSPRVPRSEVTSRSVRAAVFLIHRRADHHNEPRRTRVIGPWGWSIREAGWCADAVGGLTLGADPIAYAIA